MLQIFDKHDFDRYVEGLCRRFNADDGRPGLAPGRCFRLLLIGYLPQSPSSRALVGRRLCQRAPIHAEGLGVGTGLRPAVISQWLNQEFDGAPTNVSGSR